MPRNILRSFIGFLGIGVALIITVLLGIIVLINYLISIGITFDTTSDRLTLIIIFISLVALVVTFGCNYWTFRITSHEYKPVLKAEFVSVPPFAKGKGERFVVKLRNVGKRNMEPSQVSFTGTWFKERIDCELDCDVIQPQETEKARAKLPYPSSGNQTVTIRVMDDEAGMIWKKDKDFYMPTIDEIRVTP